MAKVSKSIFHYFQQFAQDCAGGSFLADETRQYTVLETFQEVIVLSNHFYRAGIRAGSLVALRSTRSLDAYLLLLALEFLGASAVLTDPHQTVQAFLQDTGVSVPADAWITNERAAGGTSANGNWEMQMHSREHCETQDQMWQSLKIGWPARQEARQFPVGEDIHAPAVIVFTSGSTGKSKGAMLSQQALLQYAEDQIMQPWHAPGDAAIVTLPTNHGFALCLLTAAVVARYALFFPRSMQPDYVLDCMERYAITRINAVPSYFYALAQANEHRPRDLHALRTGFTAGAPIIPEQHRYVEQVLDMVLHPLYGMSESISISSTAPGDCADIRAHTVGRFHRDAGVILDREGNPLPQGQEGEICLSGPSLMNGYYRDPEATLQAIDAEGRLHTGDLGYLDPDGYLHISGRIKDIIIRNGINLPPARIEAAIRSLPGVENASVVGIPDERVGEMPCALVVLRPGADLTPEVLKKQLAEILPKYEAPAEILLGNEIPHNRTGKPDKGKVRELFQNRRAL